MGGGRSSRCLDKGSGGGSLQKNVFWPFGPPFGLNIPGGPGPSSGSVTGTSSRNYGFSKSHSVILCEIVLEIVSLPHSRRASLQAIRLTTVKLVRLGKSDKSHLMLQKFNFYDIITLEL